MKTILVPLDFSDATSPVLETAGALAHAFQAKLVLLHVINPVPTQFVTIDRFALSRRDAESTQLKDWQEKLQTDGFSVETIELAGDPADCIREEAQRRSADYVVIGSHGHGALYDLVMGGTVKSLLKQVSCPVLIVPISGSRAPIFDSGAEPGALPADPYGSGPCAWTVPSQSPKNDTSSKP